jgi:release factor H-coupled RctB family protein
MFDLEAHASLGRAVVHPHLIGNDIGCGYSLFQTTSRAKQCNPIFLASCMVGLDLPWNGETQDFLYGYDVKTSDFVRTLGTVGGGNHFAELQKITHIANDVALKNIFIDPEFLVLLVHSGSRSYGEDIFRKFASEVGAAGLTIQSDMFLDYMKEHDNAVKWAKANRGLIAYRMLEALDSGCNFILDIPHNFIEPYKEGFIHRKGASPADRGIVPLPGSRGANTYLIQPNFSTDVSLSSLAHGAGRKSSRGSMLKKFDDTKRKITKSHAEAIVVCGDDQLIREEHPTAYKSIEKVLEDLEFYCLASSITTCAPVVTYKSEKLSNREDKTSKRSKEDVWRQERRQANRR